MKAIYHNYKFIFLAGRICDEIRLAVFKRSFSKDIFTPVAMGRMFNGNNVAILIIFDPDYTNVAALKADITKLVIWNFQRI